MYTKDQKILRFSMLLLFLALMIVYIIRYQIKGIELREKMHEQEKGAETQIVTINDAAVSDSEDAGLMTQEIIDTTGIPPKTEITVTNADNFTEQMVKKNTIRMLSGTSIYYGSIDIIEKLGIKYQYALIDNLGIRYIYLGTPNYNFANIARALNGNIYTMATEKEILDNKLFGNKVVFINLPEYKNKQVIMLVYMNDGIRLIQIEYEIYHESKGYLKSLFTD